MSHREYLEFEHCDIARETEKAFEVVRENGELTWLPKSQFAEPDEFLRATKT